MPSAARLVAAGAGLLAGTALQLQQAALAPMPVLGALGAAGLAPLAAAVAAGRTAGRAAFGRAAAGAAAARTAAVGVAAVEGAAVEGAAVEGADVEGAAVAGSAVAGGVLAGGVLAGAVLAGGAPAGGATEPAAAAGDPLRAPASAAGRCALIRSRACPRPALVWLATALGVAALAFAATSWRAAVRLADRLPAALEGRDLEVTGIVTGLPQRGAQAWRLRLQVESAREAQAPVRLPARLALAWYAQPGEALPALRAGQRWRLPVRLKRPHGLANPHGFDAELYLFEQGVGATGSVRGRRATLLDERAGAPLDRLRQAVRDAIEARVRRTPGGAAPPATAAEPATAATAHGLATATGASPTAAPGDAVASRPEGAREAGVLAALAVGDQAAIQREDWALYRDTGVAHLMSISGLHVTMFAWLAGGALGWAWRRSARLVEAVPAPRAARWGGLAAALSYAAFAGWGVPAQRTVLMLAVSTVLAGGGLHWPWPLVWGAAAVAVAAADPWALLQPGFWLSFVAVGLLLAAGATPRAVREADADGPLGQAACGTPAEAPRTAGARPRASAAASALAAARRLIADGLRTQAVATLGLAPLTLVFFQQLSLVGFAANLVAIPLVTLAITPLALLGVLLPPLWDVAAALVRGLDALLAALAALPWAVWTVAAAGPPAVALGLAGGALALLPLPRRARALALALVLPLVLPPPSRPPWGRVDALAVDVGQGGAVLLRTATHTLLYDAGPRWGPESDAGDRVLVPLLRALGEHRLDLLLLSHRDTDHVGGADALLDALPVEALASSLEPGHPLLARAARNGVAARRCGDGQRWRWDGVEFELLHPDAADFERAAASPRRRSNALSCVLQVRERAASASRVLLLPGDLEREQEAALVVRHGARLASDVLLVPHHGSKTSSSAAFLDAVAPRVAVVQAGYRNRFGHPAPVVLQRLRARGIEVVQTADCGAWRLAAGAATCWREVAPRYWRAEPAARPPAGPTGATPSAR